MPNPISNNTTLHALSFALDGLSLRQKATAHNIANVDTPGYKAQQVSFEAQLQQALQDQSERGSHLEVTHSGHIDLDSAAAKRAAITLDHQDNQLRNDGNNVDIDLEMTNLAETSLRYQSLTQLAGMKLSLLKAIIREGR
jgi:flagellar basal-body rod protein FlgB